MKQFFEWLVYIPVLWLIVFFCIIGYVTIYLGHIPQYGPDPDPSAMGLMELTCSTGYILLPSVLVWLLWPFAALAYFFTKKPIGKKYIYIYLASFLIFIGTNYTNLFGWYMD